MMTFSSFFKSASCNDNNDDFKLKALNYIYIYLWIWCTLFSNINFRVFRLMYSETVKTFHLLPFKSKMIQGSSIIWTVLFKNKGGIGPPIRYKSLSRKLEMDTFGGAHHYNQEICSSFRWTPKFSIQKSAVKVHAKGLVFLAGEICPGANNGKRNGQRGGVMHQGR